ncbi:MAG: GT4 family glycosyltransferase PelF, partial [Candidatus Rifleibacteriota bacterium]
IKVGFVGRIVSIKDVKTLLRAFKIVTFSSPKAELHLIGPLDEEQEYAAAMRQMAVELGIAEQTRFHGTQNVIEFYPELDVCVLTSISEGQPLIMLEAMAAGIPIVATDVGGCQELVYGRTREDQQLGQCGIITNIASPAETAEAIIRICQNPETFNSFVKTGKARVEKFYQQNAVIEKYRQAYDFWLDPSQRGGA